MRRYLLILAGALALAQPAWAATNAELERQVQALQQTAAAIDARLGRLEAAIQQNPQLLGLLNEVETLKSEVAKMRGQAEMHVHQMETLGRRQNDLYADLDERVTELAKAPKAPVVGAAVPAPVATPAVAAPSVAASAVAVAQPTAAPAVAAPAQPDPMAESRIYEAALGLFREADYEGAIAAFGAFLKAYPTSTLAANAQYWVGYSHYALKDYKVALAHQQKLLVIYPTSIKVPDALLNIATNQLALDDLEGARQTLGVLVAKHPGTNAASLAARRLSALK